MRSIDLTPTHFQGDPRFTGPVSGADVAPPEDAALHAFVVSYEAGGRTAWHSHVKGQLLICTTGTGWVGTRNGHLLRLTPGTAVWTDPGEEHWHGAGSDSSMTHIAVQTRDPASDEDEVRWLEPVDTDLLDDAPADVRP